MSFRNQWLKFDSRIYREAAGPDGEGDGGSGGGAKSPASEKPKSDPTDHPAGPSESEAKLIKEVMAKKEKIKAQEAALAELQSKLKAFDGIDPVQVAALLKEREEAEKAKLEDKGEWEKLKAKMAEEHTKEAKRLADELAQAQSLLEKKNSTIVELTIGQRFDSSKFLAETVYTPRKARVIYGAHFDVDSDGHVIGYDKPRGDSDRAPLVDANGNALPFEEALKRLVDADPDRDDILRSKLKPGAGSSSDPGKPKPEPRKLSSVERIAAGLEARKK